MREREPYEVRRAAQRAKPNLPLVPTTTLGSFPPSDEVLHARYELARARSSGTTAATRIRLLEDIGLDVLVHGEHERNDMVQYFGELLDGFHRETRRRRHRRRRNALDRLGATGARR